MTRVMTRWLAGVLVAGVAITGYGMTNGPIAPAYGEGVDVYTTSGGMALSGDLLVMTWPAGSGKKDRTVSAIDVSDPAKPRLVWRLLLDGFPQDVAVEGTTVYVVNGLDLLVADATDPAAIRILALLKVADDPLYGPQGVAVQGDMAYLACRRGGVKAVDVSRPSEPRLAAERPAAGFVRGVTVAGGLLVAAEDAAGIEAFDITKKGTIGPGRRLPAPRGAVGRVRVRGDVAYAAAGDVLAACLSFKSGEPPAWLGMTEDRRVFTPFFGSYSHDLAILEKAVDADGAGARRYAVVADGECGLVAVDVTDPMRPVFAGAVREGSFSGGAFVMTAVVAAGDHVFACDDLYGLRVADFSDPARPVLLGEGLKLKP